MSSVDPTASTAAPKTYLIYADGACSANGKAYARASGSFAVYVVDTYEEGKDYHYKLSRTQPLYHEARFDVPVIGGRPTNNMAEAQTLYSALIWACENGLLNNPGNVVHLCMDSLLVLNQFTGLYACKNSQLRDVYIKIYDLLRNKTEEVGYDVEKLIHVHWISGDTMKASVICH